MFQLFSGYRLTEFKYLVAETVVEKINTFTQILWSLYFYCF